MNKLLGVSCFVIAGLASPLHAYAAGVTNTGDVTCANPGTGADACIIGNTATGTQTVDGVATSHAITIVGETSTGNGTLTIQNGGSVTVPAGASNFFSFGRDGKGTGLVSSGGSISTPFLELGTYATGSGELTVTGTGSTLTSSGPILVGRSGSGNLTLQLGATGSADTISTAEFAGSSGAITVNNATLSVAGYTNVGFTGIGSLSVGDGGQFSSPIIDLGISPTGNGTLNVSGSGTNVTVGKSTGSFFAVGGEGTGTFNLTSGATMSVPNAIFATETGSSATVLVSGAGTTLTNAGTMEIGRNGTANMTISDGASVTNNDGTRVALNAPGQSSTASLTVSGGATLTTSSIAPATASMAIGNVAGSNGTVLVTGAGSKIDSKSFLNIGVQGTGALTIENGGKVLATQGRFGTTATTGNATVTVDGATSLLDAGSLIRMSIQSTLNPADPHGTSLLTLKNGATVRATDIYVGESGTIKGNGTLDGNVTLLGGTLSPGLSPGQITITGDLTMNSGKIVIEIAGLGPGQFDVLDVGGTANLLAGTVEFDFINGFAPQAGDQIDFLSAASVLLGTGVAFTYNGLAPGFEFDVDPTTGGLVFTAINNGVSVPEPSALAVLAASLAGFWLVQARRIRRRSVAAI